MKASIVVIGDEILLGHVADINTTYLARRFDEDGIEMVRVRIVGDNEEEIAGAVRSSLAESDFVVTTGGLGPTKDDITKRVLAKVFDCELTMRPELIDHIERVMQRRGREINDLTRTQAMLPSKCTPLCNRVGTAPGMLFTTDDDKRLVALPGVPFEMRDLFDNEVEPLLGECLAKSHRFIWVDGMSESSVAEILDPLGAHIAYLPQAGYLQLRLDGRKEIAKEADICRLLGEHVFATTDDGITLSRMLIDRMASKGLSVATAESCTGGNIAHCFTMEPGASEVFKGGVVAYSNDAKVSVLGVNPEDIADYGSVSEIVVGQMARGAAEAMKADMAVATSGIAGPGGGTPSKPVGTVCFGMFNGSEVKTLTLHLPGDRGRVIDSATNRALILLFKALS